MNIKGWWQRTRDWLSNSSGRVRALINEIPDAAELLADIDAESAVRYGDAVSAVEPQDSRLLKAVIRIAALLEFVAPVAGIGGDKERALIHRARQVAQRIGVIDQQFDDYWERSLRPALVQYIEKRKRLSGELTARANPGPSGV